MEIRHAIDPAERAGHQEDEQHDHYIIVADSLGTNMDLLVKSQTLVLQKGRDQRDRKGQYDRHDIKAHLPFRRFYILKKDSVSQINYQKQKYGKQRFGVSFRRRFFRLVHDVLLSDM